MSQVSNCTGDSPFLLVSSEIPGKLRQTLSDIGKLLLLPPLPDMPAPVASHADILTFMFEDTLYLYDSYYRAHGQLFSGLHVRIFPLALKAGAYPLDAQLDILPFKGKMLARKELLPEKLKELALTVDVRQGYARCSSLVLEDAVITADRSVGGVVEKEGGSVLLIQPGGIALPGYNCGFIGGASAVVGDTVLFFGDPHTHPDGERICRFIRRKGYTVKALSEGILTDYGGITVVW